MLYREKCFHSGWDGGKANQCFTSDAVWKTSCVNSVWNMHGSNVPLSGSWKKMKRFESCWLIYTWKKSKRNLIINRAWTSWTLLWVLHPVGISVRGASLASKKLGLPVTNISITDDVQTATDPVLSRHLSQNPPLKVPFFALNSSKKPKCSV